MCLSQNYKIWGLYVQGRIYYLDFNLQSCSKCHQITHWSVTSVSPSPNTTWLLEIHEKSIRVFSWTLKTMHSVPSVYFPPCFPWLGHTDSSSCLTDPVGHCWPPLPLWSNEATSAVHGSQSSLLSKGTWRVFWRNGVWISLRSGETHWWVKTSPKWGSTHVSAYDTTFGNRNWDNFPGKLMFR